MKFDHLAAGQQDEALGGIAATDDFERPAVVSTQGIGEFFPGIAVIGEQMAQPRERWRRALAKSTAPLRSWLLAA